MTATVAPTVAEARETVPQAIDDANRALEVAMNHLKLLKAEYEARSGPPFVRVFPPREAPELVAENERLRERERYLTDKILELAGWRHKFPGGPDHDGRIPGLFAHKCPLCSAAAIERKEEP